MHPLKKGKQVCDRLTVKEKKITSIFSFCSYDITLFMKGCLDVKSENVAEILATSTIIFQSGKLEKLNRSEAHWTEFKNFAGNFF